MSGIVLMFLVKGISNETAYTLFYIFHPAHVILSAIVTASIFNIYTKKQTGKRVNFFKLLLIGYVGAVGIGTLSDSLIPYLGEMLLNLPHRHLHVGFIEEWWLVNPLAILGVVIAYFIPTTKLPHAGHVLISTWASLFHMIMALGLIVTPAIYAGIFFFLFISVWVPCCVSDIAFPLLFIKGADVSPYGCSCTGRSHTP